MSSEDHGVQVEAALRAADHGAAGHWPTAAGLLAAEVRRLRRLVPEDDEDTVRVPREATLQGARETLVDLLAALPPREHSCFRPQGCVACGRSKERDAVRSLLVRKLAEVHVELDTEDGTR